MALGVAIRSVQADEPVDGAISIEVSVVGGQGEVRMFVHVDGDLVGAWDGGTGVYTFMAPDRLRPRRVLTARAVDRTGAWGGASLLFGPAPARDVSPQAGSRSLALVR